MLQPHDHNGLQCKAVSRCCYPGYLYPPRQAALATPSRFSYLVRQHGEVCDQVCPRRQQTPHSLPGRSRRLHGRPGWPHAVCAPAPTSIKASPLMPSPAARSSGIFSTSDHCRDVKAARRSTTTSSAPRRASRPGPFAIDYGVCPACSSCLDAVCRVRVLPALQKFVRVST